MKKLLLLLIGVLLSANFFTISANDPFRTVRVTAATIKELKVITSGGSITVRGDAGAEATVEVYVTRAKWSEEEIKAVFEENYTVDVNLKNGCLYAVAKSKSKIKDWNKYGLNISFKISVPKNVNSNLKTSGGSITAEECNGEIFLLTSGGSIIMNNLSGNINAKTSGGSLNMNNISGYIEAKTSGGSVKASNVNGELITGTSGGSVNLEGISGSVKAKTSGGSMNVTVESVKEYVELSCTGGSINLTLPDGKGYDLNVKSDNNIETSGLKNFSFNGNSSNNDKVLTGTVNNGGTAINVKAPRVKLTFK